LWHDDSVKGMKLPTSCITLSKHEKEFCGFLKKVKVPTGYSMNVSRLISFLDLNVAPGVNSHDYHVFLTQMITVGIRNILPGQCSGGYNELLFFLQCNWSKSTK
jgi:hypothetical protein